MIPFLSFVHPTALWLLLLLPLLWLLALAAPRRLSPLRWWSSLLVRSLMVLALVLGLAGTQLVFGVDRITTVFLIDSSDSISPTARSNAEAFVRAALASKQPDDQAAVVVFGANALVERVPSERTTLGALASEPLVTDTNIAEAIQLGLALLPADTQQRLVLLSDGGETLGAAPEAAQLAASRDIPLDVVALGGPDMGTEALVAGLEAPANVRAGQNVILTVRVESTIAQGALLRIFAGTEVVFDQRITLEAGSNTFEAQVQASEQGFERFRAQITPDADGRVQNNEAAALVQVQGPPRVLLLASDPADATPLQRALEATTIEADVRDPAVAPATLTGLSSYDAVVLVNVPARELPVRTMAALSTYVRDLGRGLVMIGGGNSYGVGGYRDTPVEEALPVYMDVRDREERPDLALVFVIDKSGSMDACHCAGPNRSTAQLNQGGETKIDIAKEAVTQAAGLLSDDDTLGIVTFDDNARLTLPATRDVDVAEVAESIAPVQPTGGTNVGSGLERAEDVLAGVDARIKHVILLTDGWGDGGVPLTVAQRMNDQGITLSVVAAGSGSSNALENLAFAGGGRYYAAEDMAEVPEIFFQETIVAAGNYIVERPFLPARVGSSPLLGNLESLPPLYGYNGSTLKDTARNVLVTDDQSPLLSHWQYGLGRTVAWTSDTTTRWAQDWVQWQEFPQFAAQMLTWVLPTSNDERLQGTARVEGNEIVLEAAIQDDAGAPDEQAQLSATILSSDPANEDMLAEQRVTLHQVAPGEYRATLPAGSPGTYLVQLQGQRDGETVAQATLGLAVPYSSEYRQPQDGNALLATLHDQTGGRALAEPAAAFARDLPAVTRAQEIAMPLVLLALLLLPLDIALRRLLLRRRDVSAAFGRLRPQPVGGSPGSSPAEPSTIDRLQQARRRAPSRTARPTTTHPPEQPAPPPAAPRAAQPPTPTPPANAAVDPLERLRAAKERARKRVRGDE